jgi:Cdc6-like AAA superfamily ATPase
MTTQEHHTIWPEKYRPSSLDEYVSNPNLIATIRKFIDSKNIPHLLFYGTAGTGKTTLAKLIIKNVDCDAMYINASDENNVDNVRTKIKDFASNVGFSELKIVILDECLDENTLIYVLRNGEEIMISIKEADEKNDLVKSYNTQHSKIEWRPFYLWDKGEQECLRIELENGEVVVCTHDHKWYVYDENNKPFKVKASELLSGKYDYILSPE